MSHGWLSRYYGSIDRRPRHLTTRGPHHGPRVNERRRHAGPIATGPISNLAGSRPSTEAPDGTTPEHLPTRKGMTMMQLDEGGMLVGDSRERVPAAPAMITIVLPEELVLAHGAILHAAVTFACDVAAFAVVEIEVAPQE